MPTDAITMLKQDHREVRELFDQLDAVSPRAVKKAGQLRDKVVRSLSRHAAIEERVLYPVLIDCIPELAETVREGMAEHAVAEQLLAEVAGMDPQDPWFRPKVKVLAETVRHHIKEEEREIFPEVKRRLDKDQLRELADALDAERRTAPTAPPPAAQARALLDDVAGRAQELIHRFTSAAA